jgi:hypothetical protein
LTLAIPKTDPATKEAPRELPTDFGGISDPPPFDKPSPFRHPEIMHYPPGAVRIPYFDLIESKRLRLYDCRTRLKYRITEIYEDLRTLLELRHSWSCPACVKRLPSSVVQWVERIDRYSDIHQRDFFIRETPPWARAS